MEIPAHTTMAREATPWRLEQPEPYAVARYEALLRISLATGAQRDPEGLFGLLATALRQVVTCDMIGMAQYDEATHKVHGYLTMTGDIERGMTDGTTPEQTLIRWVYWHQQPLMIPFVDRETHFPRTMKVIEQYGIRSLCTLPLTTVPRRIGSFVTGSMHPNAYSDEVVRSLSLVVDIIALAIDDELNVDASRRARPDGGRSHDRPR